VTYSHTPPSPFTNCLPLRSPQPSEIRVTATTKRGKSRGGRVEQQCSTEKDQDVGLDRERGGWAGEYGLKPEFGG